MLTRKFSPFLFVVSACTSFQLAGCSLVGFTIGAVSDASAPHNVVLPLSELSALKDEDVVSVVSRDSSVAQGEYAGMDTLSSAEYAERYTRQMIKLSSAMVVPLIGDSLTIITGGRKGMKTRNGMEVWKRAELHARLIGFDPGAIRVQPNGVRTCTQLPLYAVDTVFYGQGWTLTGETLQRYMDAGSIPFLHRGVTILPGRDTSHIPLGRASLIEKKLSKNAKWYGLIIGAAVDAILVLWFQSDHSVSFGPGFKL